MKLPIVCFLALLLLILPASASDSYTATGTTSYSGTADSGNVYSLIEIKNIDLDTIGTINLTSSTYSFTASFSNVTALSCTANVVFTDYVTGNTSYYSSTMYHYYSLFDPYFTIGQKKYTTGFITGGVGSSQYFYMEDAISYAPSEFSYSSNGPVDLVMYQIDDDSSTGFTLTESIANLVNNIPVVGPYLSTALIVTGYILSTFFTTAFFIIDNWAILLMTFETFVLLHAITLLQGKGKQSKKIANALRSIASDNKAMLDFVISVFVKILSLIFDIIKALPFT